MKIELNLHDAKKDLPQESGEYLCFFRSGSILTFHFSKRYKAFNIWDGFTAPEHEVHPEFWAEIPEEIKDELECRWKAQRTEKGGI